MVMCQTHRSKMITRPFYVTLIINFGILLIVISSLKIHINDQCLTYIIYNFCFNVFSPVSWKNLVYC